MDIISHEWKVDFAVIISLLALTSTIVIWIIERRRKARDKATWAYEQVFEDVSYILLYPFKKRRIESKKLHYHNEDLAFEKAVRLFIDSHWMNKMWGLKKYLPDHIKDRTEQYEYLNRVSEEARKFQDKIFSCQADISLAEISPVYYMDDEDIVIRFQRIIRFVGQNLSLFSKRIQKLWEDANYHDPIEVKHEYDKAYEVCKNFFKHNQRDFDDPYYDLLERLRIEYRGLKRSRIREAIWTIQFKIERYKYRISKIFRRLE